MKKVTTLILLLFSSYTFALNKSEIQELLNIITARNTLCLEYVMNANNLLRLLPPRTQSEITKYRKQHSKYSLEDTKKIINDISSRYTSFALSHYLKPQENIVNAIKNKDSLIFQKELMLAGNDNALKAATYSGAAAQCAENFSDLERFIKPPKKNR